MVIARWVHLAVAWLFVVGVVVQVFLAGLGVFDVNAGFDVHRTWGFTLELIPIVMLLLVGIGRIGWLQAGIAIVLFAMFLLQSLLVNLRSDQPAIAALHPVNGFGILLLGIVAARRAWAERHLGRDATSFGTSTSGRA
jgi:hypothetical protein